MMGTKWQLVGKLGRSRCLGGGYCHWGRQLRHSHGKVDVIPIDEVDATEIANKDADDNTIDDDRLAALIRPSFQKQTPLVLRQAMSTVPAVQRWPNFISLWPQELPTHHLGAVEIGGTYATADRAEIPIGDFLHYLQLFEERHGRYGPDDPWQSPTQSASSVTNSSSSWIDPQELVYMAQNDLPLPLYKDISIPKFCQEEHYRVGLGRLYSVMMWVGPRGCTSPLHFDPLDNILMQFVGRKVVWLFIPHYHHGDDGDDGAMWHYAGHEGQQSNTSPVNPENVDRSRYPRFLEEGPPAVCCVLEPGDVLYIPSRWWHYVRSVDTSISVNVWWR